MKTSIDYRYKLWLLPLLLAALWSGLAAAAQTTEIIQLNYRSADEVIPILQSFADPDAVLRGDGNKVIIRTSPANLEELKKLLADIDKVPQGLVVAVRMTGDRMDNLRGNEVSRKTGTGNEAQRQGSDAQRGTVSSTTTTRVTRSYRRETSDQTHRLQVLDGQWAYVNTGVSIPIVTDSGYTWWPGRPFRDGAGIEYKDVTSGFDVNPRLSGDRVTLTIRPHRQTLSERGGGNINIQDMHTTITTRLGEWVELGGSGETENTSGRGTTYSTRHAADDVRYLYLKVDLAP